MSDQINHECGLALIRLLKPLDFYKKKYGSSTYGLNKLYLMLEKQHNRGQDGAVSGVEGLAARVFSKKCPSYLSHWYKVGTR